MRVPRSLDDGAANKKEETKAKCKPLNPTEGYSLTALSMDHRPRQPRNVAVTYLQCGWTTGSGVILR